MTRFGRTQSNGIRTLVPALAAAGGASLLVAVWAAARPLWLDEEMIAINLRDRGIASYVHALWLGQTAPFAWLLVQRVVVVVFGSGERALRFIPIVFGVLTIATAVWIGRRWLTTAGAVVLALLCSSAQWLTFYFAELKPYSGDAFFALLLPALAARAGEADDERHMLRRMDTFWIVAAIGMWLANGALFVTPACALVLIVFFARRYGWRAAWRGWRPVVFWFGAFVLHYAVALRHASASAFFHAIWAFAFPPPAAGLFGTLRWFAARLPEFGAKPGGARFGIALWLVAVAGFVCAERRQRLLAILYATVPCSAIGLAVAGVVPFFERLTLWILPAVYVGVALCADAAVAFGGSQRGGRRPIRLGVAAAAVVLVALLSADIASRGLADGVVRFRARRDNRQLDDRDGVRFLAAQKQPGDVWITTHYGVVAVWWYAGIDQPIVEVGYQPLGAGCRRNDLADALPRATRLLAYLGFRFDDVPRGFDDLFVSRLSELGLITGYRPFAFDSYALVVDRRVPASAPATLSRLSRKPPETMHPIDGCLEVRPTAIESFLP